MPVVYKLDQNKRRNKTVTKVEDIPVQMYTWRCKCGKTQKVGIRCYSVKCGCNKMMKCDSDKGELK